MKDLVQELTISSRKLPLASCSLLLSQGHVFLNNHLARFPIAPKQEATMEMRQEVLSRVGAQDVDTNEYQLFDQDELISTGKKSIGCRRFLETWN